MVSKRSANSPCDLAVCSGTRLAEAGAVPGFLPRCREAVGISGLLTREAVGISGLLVINHAAIYYLCNVICSAGRGTRRG